MQETCPVIRSPGMNATLDLGAVEGVAGSKRSREMSTLPLILFVPTRDSNNWFGAWG
jgi:hypothetical protein